MTRSKGLQMYSKAQGADEQSLLIEQHAPLVKRIAYHMLARLPASVQVEDLIQAGMIGLLEAAKKFDASKGASFDTFVGIRIRGAMLDDLRKGDWTPRSVHRNTRMVSEAVRKVESKTGRDAKDLEVAAELNLSLDEYYTILGDTQGSRLLVLMTCSMMAISLTCTVANKSLGVILKSSIFNKRLLRRLLDCQNVSAWYCHCIMMKN